MIALITYPRTVFTTKDMVNALAFSQTTNVDKITRRGFLDFQALTVLNLTLLDNLSMYDHSNDKVLFGLFMNSYKYT